MRLGRLEILKISHIFNLKIFIFNKKHSLEITFYHFANVKR